MKNVLYIYDYNESVESDMYNYLNEKLDDNVICIPYDQNNPDESIKQLSSIIESDINIVIASGLGAWYAMYISMPISLPCILINPVWDNNFKDTYFNIMSADILEKYLIYIKDNSFDFDYYWERAEDGGRIVVIRSDNDEVVKQNKKFLLKNFRYIYDISNAKHTLNIDEMKYVYDIYKMFTKKILPQYNKFFENQFPQMCEED